MNDDLTSQSDQPVEFQQQQSTIAMVGSFFLELIKVVVLAGVTIILVRHFLFKPFYVKGQSMEPTFQERDYLIIDELTYRFREPQRGEVVVFRAPAVEKDFYLKRIVGMPGERVKVEDGKVVIYNEDNPQGFVFDNETSGSITVTLGPDQYFVLGDNRGASLDSRRFGPIYEDAIVGRAWIRGLPISNITVFDTPEYDL